MFPRKDIPLELIEKIRSLKDTEARKKLCAEHNFTISTYYDRDREIKEAKAKIIKKEQARERMAKARAQKGKKKLPALIPLTPEMLGKVTGDLTMEQKLARATRIAAAYKTLWEEGERGGGGKTNS